MEIQNTRFKFMTVLMRFSDKNFQIYFKIFGVLFHMEMIRLRYAVVVNITF